MHAQENGNNADGSSLSSQIESGEFVIPQAGEKLMSIRRFIPDFKNLEGTVNVSLIFSPICTSMLTNMLIIVFQTRKQIATLGCRNSNC